MVKVVNADIDRLSGIEKDLPWLGRNDRDVMIKAFAAHRIAAIEECAKVAESDLFTHGECDVAESIAEEIRALKGGNDD